MIEAILRFSGIALIAAFVSLLLKERYKGTAVAAVLIAIVLISLESIKNGVYGALAEVLDISQSTSLSEYVIVLQKALGIGYITTIIASLCRDAGEPSLAASLEFAGKIQLLLLTLPLVSSLLEIAKELL